jgi:hypothetical protein
MDQKEYIEKLQEQINQIIGAQSTLKRRKKTNEDTQREIFISTISLLTHIVNRGPMMHIDYGLDMTKYDEPFFQIIDSFIFMHFGKEAGELVSFYVYERTNPDGTVNPIYDEDDNPIPLERIEDLWELIKQVKK